MDWYVAWVISDSRLKIADSKFLRGEGTGKKLRLSGCNSVLIRFFEKRLMDQKSDGSKIILFGSRAKGKGHAESDVDIVLLSEDFQKKIFKGLELIKEAQVATIKKFMIPLDVIMMTPEEFEGGTSLLSEYAKKGTVLFAARSPWRHRLLSSAIRRCFPWALAQRI